MRCIEIDYYIHDNCNKDRLTLTWDVLKYTEEYGIVHCGGD